MTLCRRPICLVTLALLLPVLLGAAVWTVQAVLPALRGWRSGASRGAVVHDGLQRLGGGAEDHRRGEQRRSEPEPEHLGDRLRETIKYPRLRDNSLT